MTGGSQSGSAERTQVILEVCNPSGEAEATSYNAPRLGNLHGKTIGFISNSLWEAERVLGLLEDLLQQQRGDITIIPHNELPGVVDIDQRHASLSILQQKGCQAVIVGNGG